MRNRKTTPTTLKLNPRTREMTDRLSTGTGWSFAVAGNRLIEIGMYYFASDPEALHKTVDATELAFRKHAIELQAKERIAALKNQKFPPPPRPKRTSGNASDEYRNV